MKLSTNLVSLLLLLLLAVLTQAQDPSPPPSNLENSVPPVASDSSTGQPQVAQDNNTPSTTTQTPPKTNEPTPQANINTDTNNVDNDATNGNPTPSPSSGSITNTGEDKVEDDKKEGQKQIKEQIKKMLSHMSQDQIDVFEKQLAGDARRYYNQILREEEQKQAQEAKWERQEEQNIQKETTPTDTQSKKETAEFNALWEKYSDREISYNEYLFELDQTASQDFRFSIPVNQQVTFYGYTYQNKDGVYSVPETIEGQQPLWVYVYENNHKIVHQQQFYFKYFAEFQGQENASYLIRFVNPSTQKLIAFNLAVLFEIGHSADKLTAIDVADHSRRIKVVREQVENRYHDVNSREVMALENKGALLDKLERYFAYSIVEILIIAVLCVIQVEFVRKLLSNTSVV